MSLNELALELSLVDLPRELFALVASYLEISDVCKLRGTCRTLAGYNAELAGACMPAYCELIQDDVCAPEAVLAWAVGGAPQKGEEAATQRRAEGQERQE